MSASILAILFLALLLDRLVGDPDWLWRRLPHPVVAFGKAISIAERLGNRPNATPEAKRRAGKVAIALLLVLAALIGALLHALLWHFGPLGFLVEVVIVAVLLAQKSLSDHVARVSVGLRSDGLAGGRAAVSMIVGRDPERLDRAGISRAAIESLAENFSDGVVAPAFWYAVAGLPGLLAYKMLNTADSMIGHRTERYVDFGRASARLDDVANWPAARLSMLLVASGALWTKGMMAGRSALRVGLRDGALHRSPNGGWPEAAMAGGLDIQLSGPRSYDGGMVSEPIINAAGRADINGHDIDAAISIFKSACSNLAACIVILLGLTLALSCA